MTFLPPDFFAGTTILATCIGARNDAVLALVRRPTCFLDAFFATIFLPRAFSAEAVLTPAFFGETFLDAPVFVTRPAATGFFALDSELAGPFAALAF